MAEQMLVDCGMGDCNGGWADRAFDTIKTQGGCCLEEDYPYTAHNGKYSHIFFTMKMNIQNFILPKDTAARLVNVLSNTPSLDIILTM